MTNKNTNPYVLIALYFCCVFFPIAVYAYCKKIKLGLVVTTASELTILAVVAIILTYNYPLEVLIVLIIAQLFAFGFVIYHALKLLLKKEKEKRLEQFR